MGPIGKQINCVLSSCEAGTNCQYVTAVESRQGYLFSDRLVKDFNRLPLKYLNFDHTEGSKDGPFPEAQKKNVKKLRHIEKEKIDPIMKKSIAVYSEGCERFANNYSLDGW